MGAASASLWVALTVLATAFLLTKQLAGHNLVTAILVRVAALLYLAAGVIGAKGWIGGWITDLRDWIIGTTNDASQSALNTAITLGVLVFVGSVLWLLALLPDSWWGGQMPDWGSVAGLFLAGLASSIPGPAGHLFRDRVFPALARPMVRVVASWFGVHL